MNAVAVHQFVTVTEQPGQSASLSQLSMLAARYAWARSFASGRDVLEAACGSGIGLGVLVEVARTVEAGDIDAENLAAAHATYRGEANIRIATFDAADLPYEDASFDLVLLFEALYYLPSAAAFFEEAYRVLRPSGHLLIATANREWTGFNPSPFSTRYLSADELQEGLAEAGFSVELKAGFAEQTNILSVLTSFIRRTAVALGLVPRTMAGKAFLKRLFYGPLEEVPARMEARHFSSVSFPSVGQPAGHTAREAVRPHSDLSQYRVLYAAARKGF